MKRSDKTQSHVFLLKILERLIYNEVSVFRERFLLNEVLYKS